MTSRPPKIPHVVPPGFFFSSLPPVRCVQNPPFTSATDPPIRIPTRINIAHPVRDLERPRLVVAKTLIIEAYFSGLMALRPHTTLYSFYGFSIDPAIIQMRPTVAPFHLRRTDSARQTLVEQHIIEQASVQTLFLSSRKCLPDVA